MIERRRSIRLGLTPEELQQEIAARLARLDALAEHAEEETQFAEYDRFVAELGPCEVIATGGLAEPIIEFSRTVQHYEPWLTLYGLRIIFERNR